jgi:hypothetical protein
MGSIINLGLPNEVIDQRGRDSRKVSRMGAMGFESCPKYPKATLIYRFGCMELRMGLRQNQTGSFMTAARGRI